jgi:hypothetical protein
MLTEEQKTNFLFYLGLKNIQWDLLNFKIDLC